MAGPESEIAELRAEPRETLRPTVPALEEVLYKPIQVLDHGFVRAVDYMGDDSAIVQAARVSYGRGTRRVSEDRGLIRYLMRHRHSTPFEMASLKLHVRLPIFVARQWIRHRTQSYNEISARYSVLDREFYVPEPSAMAVQSAANRQGRGEVLEPEQAEELIRLLIADAGRNYDHYLEMLNENEDGTPIDPDRSGLTRELARMNLTLATYTQWYCKTDLHNWLGFVSLRADPHAQYEIRVYADAILDLLERWVPLTTEAFRDYRLNGAHLSAGQLQVIRRRLAGDAVKEGDCGLSAREWRELTAILEG